MVRAELILSSEAGTESFLKLKVLILMIAKPIIEETVQNNTLIQTDFKTNAPTMRDISFIIP